MLYKLVFVISETREAKSHLWVATHSLKPYIYLHYLLQDHNFLHLLNIWHPRGQEGRNASADITFTLLVFFCKNLFIFLRILCELTFVISCTCATNHLLDYPRQQTQPNIKKATEHCRWNLYLAGISLVNILDAILLAQAREQGSWKQLTLWRNKKVLHDEGIQSRPHSPVVVQIGHQYRACLLRHRRCNDGVSNRKVVHLNSHCDPHLRK